MTYARRHRRKYTPRFGGHVTLTDRPPQDAIDERDRAFSVVETVEQHYFGDPLPGRSAAERLSKPDRWKVTHENQRYRPYLHRRI
jgi:hypothetical protein